MDRQKVLAIVGPTGIGKTSLSVWLAKQLDGEIISCDSMQVYKKMDIGTAKVTQEEMQGIHHETIMEFHEESIDPFQMVQIQSQRMLFFH